MPEIDDTLKKLSDAVASKGRFTKKDTTEAYAWFKQQVTDLKNMNANQFMNEDTARLRQTPTLGKQTIGQMIMFFYDAKTKEDLPYWDKFPLIFHLEIYPDGFLGINLHYISPWQRAKLLIALYRTRTSPRSKEMKLKINYQILKGISEASAFKPCVKRYLYKTNDPTKPGGVRSRFKVIDPKEWIRVINLPLERFVKGGRGAGAGGDYSKSKVWNDAARKRPGYRPHRRRRP